MAFELALLLNAGHQALDRLWLRRASRDVGFLLADHTDPGFVSALEGEVAPEEAVLRAHLLRIGAQMRAVGLPAVARAVLAAPLPEARKLVLLALAGSTAWASLPGRPGLCWRPAPQGAAYHLSCRAGADAAHAPHAIRERHQQLWLTAAAGTEAGSTPLRQLESGTACLSLDVALWEVLSGLEAAGQAPLAAAIDALQPRGTLATPAEEARPLRRRLARAAA